MLHLLLPLLGCRSVQDDSGADRDGDGYPDAEDCAPEDRSSFPNAFERCDGVDNDCDGLIDELYDLDADGFLAGDEAGCRALGGPLDCDDGDPAVNPDAEELCNGVDDDCSGRVDDAPDGDGDGWGACEDCDDEDPAVNPGATELCNAVDDDCSGRADEPFDKDGDGVGSCLDCDDEDRTRSPLSPESCDWRDNDCDDQVDEDFDLDLDGWTTCAGDCDDASADTHPGAFEACDGVDNDCDDQTVEDADADGDGFRLCDDDCDDRDPLSFPGAEELCDGLDNACDGWVDNAPACWSCTEEGDRLFCKTGVTWEDAVDVCASMDTELLRIDDATENAAVRARLQPLLGNHSWISLGDHAEEGRWVWLDGSEPSYTAWHGGEPNDYGSGEDCAELYYNYGTWNDATCASSLPFVCER